MAAMLLSTAVAGAQEPATQETEVITDQEMQDLQLTETQRNQVQAIRQAQRDQIKAVAQDASLTGPQKAEKISAIHRSTHEQINGVLTPEQRARYNRSYRDRRENRRDRREDVRDRREDRRDRKHDGGVGDKREDRRDRREDKRDRREDRRDRKTPGKRPPR
jgi:Spy/CpxP family protein refolding chaperone